MSHIKNIKFFSICIVIAVVYLTIYSTTTTPLLNGKWGLDSAFFILVGQGMTKGLMPYRDFFDMKGPFLFFLEFIGQKICYGRTGAFVIQCINLSCSLFVTGKISDLFSVTNKTVSRRILCILAFLLIASVTFEGGNLTEEFCLTPILICLYFCLKYFKTSEETKCYKHSIFYSVFYGVAVAYICFIRITNAAMIGSVLIAVFIYLLSKKEYKSFIVNVIAVLLGFVLVCGVIVIYFSINNLLSEMLNQVFVFGFTYSSANGLLSKMIGVLITYKGLLLLLVLPILSCFLYREAWYYKLLSLFSAFLLLVAVSIGNAYLHYSTLFIPHVVFGISIFIKNANTQNVKIQKRVYVAFLSLVLLVNGVQFFKGLGRGVFTIYSYLNSNYGVSISFASSPSISTHIFSVEENRSALDVVSKIPDSERENVYCFGAKSWSWFYGVTGTMPSYRYMDWQDNYIHLVPDIETYIANWIENDGAKWLITTNTNTSISKVVNNSIENCYTIEYSNEEYILFRRNTAYSGA